jgi:hypothetical protein
VWANAVEFLMPSTHWHPHDEQPSSPHFKHRQALGGYERIYDRLLHGFPAPPVGLYLLMPVVVIAGAWRVRSDWRAPGAERLARARLLGVCLLQIGFVTASSLLLANGEAQRYRYQIDPLLWILTAVAIGDLATRLRRRRGQDALDSGGGGGGGAAAASASRSSLSADQPQSSFRQRSRTPDLDTFSTTNAAWHCGQGRGTGRSQLTKSHLVLL